MGENQGRNPIGKALVRKKSRMKREAFEAKKANNNEQSRKQYARLCNQVKWEVRKAVKQFERRIAQDSKKNPKGFYTYVKSKTRVRAGIPELYYDDKVATDDHDKAEALNQFYTSVFTQEDDNIPRPENMFTDATISDILITEKMIKDKLDKLNQNKSPGNDNHHPRVLIELKELLVKPLTYLFQRSLCEGYLPECWREANITPIYKNKGTRSHPTNYRPVSLTSIICKMMESLIKDAIIDHLKSNHLLYKYQHAFIGKRSCTTNLLEVLNIWTKLPDEDETVDAVYLDFAKAFDSVPHKRLLVKWEALGIGGKILKWISTFLKCRQRVKVNGSPSSWVEVISGVPQGSVLGPVLFVIFINDMPEQISSFLSLFADDAKLYAKSSTPEQQSTIQEDLSKLQSWSDIWQLHFNKTKCKTLYLGKNNVKKPYHMQNNQDRVILDETVAEKDLGVMIDQELKFECHIAEAIRKANTKLGMIKRTFVCLDEPMLSQLYIALVRPHLEYANVTWSPNQQQHIQAIEAVQHRATRLIPGISNLPYEERLKRLKLPSLSYRRLRGDMIEAYKYCHGEYEVHEKPFKFLRDVNSATRTRDNGFKIYKDKSKSAARANFFGNRVANVWNTLPPSVVQAPNINCFKNRLDKLWEPHKYTEDLRTVPHRTNSVASLNFDDE